MASSDYEPTTRESDFNGVVAVIGVFLIVYWLSNAEYAIAYAGVFAAFLTIAQTKKKEERDRRFWFLLFALAALHVIALQFIRIPKLAFGMEVFPFVLADGFTVWWLIDWIERRLPPKT